MRSCSCCYSCDSGVVGTFVSTVVGVVVLLLNTVVSSLNFSEDRFSSHPRWRVIVAVAWWIIDSVAKLLLLLSFIIHICIIIIRGDIIICIATTAAAAVSIRRRCSPLVGSMEVAVATLTKFICIFIFMSISSLFSVGITVSVWVSVSVRGASSTTTLLLTWHVSDARCCSNLFPPFFGFLYSNSSTVMMTSGR